MQYCCDICNKVVTATDDYVYIESDSVMLCSNECGYKWIDQLFEETDHK